MTTATGQHTNCATLQSELVRELAHQLSMVSTCLGACRELIGSIDASSEVSRRLQDAISTASEQTLSAIGVTTSTKTLCQLQQSSRSSISLTSVIRDVLSVLSPKLAASQIRVESHFAPCAPTYVQAENWSEQLLELFGFVADGLTKSRSKEKTIFIQTKKTNECWSIRCCGLPTAESPVQSPMDGLTSQEFWEANCIIRQASIDNAAFSGQAQLHVGWTAGEMPAFSISMEQPHSAKRPGVHHELSSHSDF